MAESLQSLSDEKLVHDILSREYDLVRARFRHAQNQLENTATLSEIRRDIARMKTEVRSREITQGVSKGSILAGHRKTFGKEGGGQAAQAPAERGGFLKGIVDRLTGNE